MSEKIENYLPYFEGFGYGSIYEIKNEDFEYMYGNTIKNVRKEKTGELLCIDRYISKDKKEVYMIDYEYDEEKEKYEVFLEGVFIGCISKDLKDFWCVGDFSPGGESSRYWLFGLAKSYEILHAYDDVSDDWMKCL